mmetsp:Transcript_36247/g.80487  ORF Transcript_36247/g.80487 Transcript_36247/m.80487 type:complete len:285 (-) Transcript_36247:355-1209(-)
MIPRNCTWGSQGTRGSPRMLRRRLAYRGGPALTANTPALGRGYSTLWQMSPAANTPLVLVLSRVGLMQINPSSLQARPVSLSQGCPTACVHQKTSSQGKRRPSRATSDPWFSWVSWVPWFPGSLPHMSAPVCTPTPFSASSRSRMVLADAQWEGITRSPRLSSSTFSSVGLSPLSRRCFCTRVCTANASSTPPAPPPTTAIVKVRRKLPASTRVRMVSQRWVNLSMGFTGVMLGLGPGTPALAEPAPAAPAPCWLPPCRLRGRGTMPMFIDSRSYLMAGLPSLQ